MKPFKKLCVAALAAVTLTPLSGCYEGSDIIQREQQERILREGTAQSGMPAITNFRERKLVKMLLEMRDQENLITYTYTYAEDSGKLTFFCQSVGYGVPYATQYTNPEKWETGGVTLPQADPNGLFMPDSADATWVMCRSDKGDVKPVYVEPKVVVSPFKLQETP